jgi:hypothetical protein
MNRPVNRQTTADRQAIHAYLTDEAHEAWQTFAEDNGVSVTGLLEAFGQTLLEEMKEADADEIRQPWVKAGRRIDASRRRRGRD